MTAIERCAVVELRRYTLHPGARETLIELFERELVAPQEDAGMHVLAQFRDLAEPDHFVWLRGFQDLASRGPALRAFYGGPVWEHHSAAANATMLDSDDVLLLRPVAVAGPPVAGPLTVVAYPVEEGAEADVAAAVAERGGARAILVTEPGPNDFPALPVREDGSYVVTLAAGEGTAAEVPHLRAAAHVARLVPTERSRPV